MTDDDKLRKRIEFIHTGLEMALNFTDAARQPREEMERRLAVFDVPPAADRRAWLLEQAQGQIDHVRRVAKGALEGNTSAVDEFYLEFHEGDAA